MLTSLQKLKITKWLLKIGIGFENRFTDMKMISEVFNLSGNSEGLGREASKYLDTLVSTGVLKSSGGYYGTVYWVENISDV